MGLHTQSRESESRVETKLRVPKGQRQHSLISISPSEAPLTSPRMARNPPSAFDPPWHELSPLFFAPSLTSPVSLAVSRIPIFSQPASIGSEPVPNGCDSTPIAKWVFRLPLSHLSPTRMIFVFLEDSVSESAHLLHSKRQCPLLLPVELDKAGLEIG